MICKNCGFENGEGARFCSNCGARLTYGQNQSSGFGQNYAYGDGNYENRRSDEWEYAPRYAAPVDVSVLKKWSIITVGVLSFLTGNFFSLVLAVIAFAYCNEYESAVRNGNFEFADRKFKSVTRIRKWAWIVEIAEIVGIMFLIVLVALGVGSTAVPFLFDWVYSAIESASILPKT